MELIQTPVERELVKAPEGEYTLLREGYRSDNSHKSLDELKIEYVQLTDQLIHTMTHGEEIISKKGETTVEKPTKVIFLDKSARPLAWLVRDLWDQLAPDPESDEVPKQPDFKFLNIDRNQWLPVLDPNKTGDRDVGRVPNDVIEGLRSIFSRSHDGSFDAKNELDDQVIMIVDEVRSSGATLEIAKALIKRAFPTSTVFGTHWMSKTVTVNGVVGNADLPVWYRDDATDRKLTPGRGVGNRLPVSKMTHPSQYFLSTRLPEVDQRALRLREDFKLLSEELREGKVLYAPDTRRDDDDAEHRSRRLNNGLTKTQVDLARLAIRKRDTEKNKG